MTTTLSAAFAFALAVMIALPIVLAVLVVRKRRLPASIPLVAGGFYLLSLAVSVPLNGFLWPHLLGSSTLLTLLLTCITWGLCEELAQYASFRWVPVMRGHRDDAGALAAGLGHGGAESILFGLQLAAGVLTLVLAPQQLQPGAQQQIIAAGPLGLVMQGLDRLPAIAGHIAFAFLVVLAFRRGVRYLPIAIGVHIAVDFSVFTFQRYVSGYWFDLFFAVIGAVALGFVARIVKSRILAADLTGGMAEPRSLPTVSVPAVR